MQTTSGAFLYLEDFLHVHVHGSEVKNIFKINNILKSRIEGKILRLKIDIRSLEKVNEIHLRNEVDNKEKEHEEDNILDTETK